MVGYIYPLYLLLLLSHEFICLIKEFKWHIQKVVHLYLFTIIFIHYMIIIAFGFVIVNCCADSNLTLNHLVIIYFLMTHFQYFNLRIYLIFISLSNKVFIIMLNPYLYQLVPFRRLFYHTNKLYTRFPFNINFLKYLLI